MTTDDLPPGPVLECERLSKTYPGEVPVTALQGATFSVYQGDQVAVCGPSGSGKSTLMNILGLLDTPTSGSYRLHGVETSELPEAERAGLRASAIGFVFQSFHLLPGRTAAENVELGLLYLAVPRRQRRTRARQVLARVGLGHRLDAEVTTLSGGERQRVAIARAIVHRPGLLLADEPTGNLDSATSDSILTLLDELAADGFAQIVVTHDETVAARASRRLDVLDGHVTLAPTTSPAAS